uniref:UBR-type domain-containing protein n=2 Tax=Clytia hemisphaerica TaxID=252671 RepID=A0A7M6DQJ0_9CNID
MLLLFFVLTREFKLKTQMIFNIMSTDANDSTEGSFVTMQDAVSAMESEEEHSIAVFGAGDEKNCTYIMGYLSRQAVFSCQTCDPTFEREAGLCYACSLDCHHEHDLVELYTKRNFKCDCGNSKYGEFKCKLQETKSEINEENKYNHNFKGEYCTCNRPYPDPEDEVDDEMIQCIVCEDWFHSRHLGSLPPMCYEEMVCDGCVQKYPFFNHYKQLTEGPAARLTTEETTTSIDVTTCPSPSKKRRKMFDNNNVEDDGQPSTSSQDSCKISIPLDEEAGTKALYFKSKWRSELCRCSKCMAMYEEKGLGFLTSDEDTIAVYEKKGKENSSRVMESAADQISQMNRVQQVELMRGYQDLKEKLHGFLEGFSKTDQVVKKEDIENFFEDLNKKRRERSNNGLPPGSCK